MVKFFTKKKQSGSPRFQKRLFASNSPSITSPKGSKIQRKSKFSRTIKIVRKLHFQTAGIPETSPVNSVVDGLDEVKRLKLDGMEIQFVYGVRMSHLEALEIGEKAESLELSLTVHGPYWINLNSHEERKRKASIHYILSAV